MTDYQHPNRRGLRLILLVAIAIVGVVVALSVLLYRNYSNDRHDAIVKSEIAQFYEYAKTYINIRDDGDSSIEPVEIMSMGDIEKKWSNGMRSKLTTSGLVKVRALLGRMPSRDSYYQYGSSIVISQARLGDGSLSIVISARSRSGKTFVNDNGTIERKLSDNVTARRASLEEKISSTKKEISQSNACARGLFCEIVGWSEVDTKRWNSNEGKLRSKQYLSRLQADLANPENPYLDSEDAILYTATDDTWWYEYSQPV